MSGMNDVVPYVAAVGVPVATALVGVGLRKIYERIDKDADPVDKGKLYNDSRMPNWAKIAAPIQLGVLYALEGFAAYKALFEAMR